MAAGRHLGTIWASVALDTAPLGAGAARARRMLYALDATASKSMIGMQTKGERMSHAFKTALVGIGKAAVMAGAVVGGVAIKMASDFDRATREVATLTGEMGASFEKMQEQLLELSTTGEQTATELAQGMYWVVSALPDASDAERMNVLEESRKLATAGLADMADTADLTTTAINAWGMSTEEAGYVNDVLFEIVKRGKTTIQELTGNFSKAASSAALMNVPIEDLGAVIATLTRVGIPADRALMALNRTLLGLNKPTKETAEWIKSLGHENAQVMIQTIGLEGFLMELGAAYGDNAEAMAAMFPNIRELLALLPLTGKNLEDNMKDFEAFTDVTGNVDEAFGIMSESFSFKMAEMMNKIRKPLIELGEKLFPHLEKAIEAVANIISGENEAFNEFAGILKTLATGVLEVGQALADIPGIIVPAVAALVALKVGAIAAGTSMGTFIGVLGGAVMSNITAGFVATTGAMTSFAAVLGTATLMAAPFALAIGMSIKQVKDMDRAMQKSHDTVYEMQDAMAPLGEELTRLRDKEKELSDQLSKTQDEEQKIAITNELHAVRDSIAQQFPQLVDGWDAERHAILKNDAAVNGLIDSLLRYSGIPSPYEGELGQLDKLTKRRNELAASIDRARESYRIIQTYAYALAQSELNLGNVQQTVNDIMTHFSRGVDEGEKHLKELYNTFIDTEGATRSERDALEDLFYSGLTPGVEGSENLREAIEILREETEDYDGALGNLEAELRNAELALDELEQQMLDTAYTTGATTGEIPDTIIQALRSIDREIHQWGKDLLAQLALGRLEQQYGIVGPEAIILAQGIADSVVSGSDMPRAAGTIVRDLSTFLTSGDNLEAVRSAGTEVGAAAKAGVVSGFAAGLMSDLAAAVIKAVTGISIPTITVPVQLGSPPDTDDTDDEGTGFFGSGINEDITALRNLLNTFQSIMGAFEAGGPVWAALNKDVLETEAAILGLTEGSQAHLDVYRQLRGVYDSNAAALAGIEQELDDYNKQIEEAQILIDGFNDELQLSQERLQKHQQALSYWNRVKLKGETAADERSRKLQRDITYLELKILEAEQAGNIERAAQLTLQKEQVEEAKRLHDLKTEVKFGEQRHELEKARDEMYGQEASLSTILTRIKEARDGIRAEELAQAHLNEKIKEQMAFQDILNVRILELQAHYDYWYNQLRDIEQVMNDIVRAIQSAAREAGVAGGTGGAGIPGAQFGAHVLGAGVVYVHPGEDIVPAKLAPINFSSSHSTTVNIPVYLDSKKIAYETTRVTGRNASLYGRSGGKI